jgi:type II secretory pathway pseudopilin PulG
MALVVLMVLSGLMGIVMQGVIAERRQMQRQSWQDQTEQLVSTAFSIAERMTDTTPGWAGTMWTLPAGVLQQTNSAEVVIRVLDGQCTVIARYPAQLEQSVRITRTRTISSKAE